MIKFIKDHKTHFIYGFLIIVIGSFCYNLFTTKPKEIVKTVVKTEVVNKDVVKTKVQYVDRVIVKTEKDGSTTTTTEHVTTDSNLVDKTKTEATFISKTSISFLSRYSLDVQYPIPLTTNPLQLTFDPKKVILTGGYRVFNTPVFITLGTNIGLDSILIGVRYEF